MRVRIGTRGSALALWQTNFVAEQLRRLHGQLSIEVLVIKTTADRFAAAALPELGGRGVFVKEIEDALLEGSVDLAVHSLKDVPTQLPPGLVLAAYLERADPADCLVAREQRTLDQLPASARVGTGSLRRACQLRRRRPDLEIVEIRGNVDTRIGRVHGGSIDAVVLAACGLERLGRQLEVSERFAPREFLPAVGQGCLTVEIREDDSRIEQLIGKLNHPSTAAAAQAERTLLAALGGGCRVPLGAYAESGTDGLAMKVFVADPRGADWFEAEDSDRDPIALGNRLAQRIEQSRVAGRGLHTKHE